MMRKILQIIFIAAAFSLLVNCSGDKNNLSDEDFLSHDKSKLGIEISDSDLGIKFSPPKDWILMPSSLSKKIEARGANPDDNFIYQPMYVFFNDSSKGVLSLGKVNTNDSTLTQNAAMNYYKSFLSGKYKSNQLELGSFKRENISFTQFRFKKENLMSIKILFENSKKEIIQIDYTIPDNMIDYGLDYIKSSIGSIQLI